MKEITQNQIDVLAHLAATIDGGCPSCVQTVCNGLNDADLGVTFSIGRDANGRAVKIYDEEYGYFVEIVTTKTPTVPDTVKGDEKMGLM